MTLVDDIRNIDSREWYSWSPDVVVTSLENVTLVEDEITDTGRWSIYHRAVFERRSLDVALSSRTGRLYESAEYAAVEYDEPATEMQEGGDFGDITVYEVEPVEVKITRYARV